MNDHELVMNLSWTCHEPSISALKIWPSSYIQLHNKDMETIVNNVQQSWVRWANFEFRRFLWEFG